MTARVTRAAAAAAAAQMDLDTATSMALPSSPAATGLDSLHISSPLATKRSTSGTKAASVQIAEDFDAGVETSPRPGSPAACAVLKPAGKAKQLLINERKGMRASSNKENMKPFGSPERAAQDAPNVVATGRIEAEDGGAVPLVQPDEDTQEDTTPVAASDNVEEESAVVLPAENAIVERDINVAPASARKEVPSQKAKRTSMAPSRASLAFDRAIARRTSALPAKTLADRRMSAAVSKTDDRRGSMAPERRTTIIPHSKPRPMSMSFPTPPPPARSTKTPTRPTFALPGEAVAARLKAAKEARAAATAAPPSPERPAFKARPAPKMTPDATNKVRATAASRARESLMFPERRASLANPVPAVRPASAAASGRQSLVSSSMSAGRPRLAPRAGAGTEKGKEVFQRAAAGREAMLKAQKDKEEAAKRARAEAAERGRQASREWAERQAAKKAAKSVGGGK